MSTSRLLFALTACLAFAPLAGASDGPTLEQRLAKLAEQLESAREDAHIAGMSIAIVKDDAVVWARGFGLADIAAERPADEHTIYAVGSTTKAFTATLVGMLVDEGALTWDDPVTRYLPYFDLAVRSDDEHAECTLRDLLSHRHGFSRMSILWFGGDVSREEILRTAAGAEPWDDFRAAFHYCNVTYLAAGMAAGVAAESTWDALIEERIFEPLGMTATTISVTEGEGEADPPLARGYEWDEVDERFELERRIDLSNVGPAGAVNSNVIDMAQWLRLQLGAGAVDGVRLISTESIRETWAPQIEMGAGAAYGLGWMLREHDGRQVVEHGGNIDGFSAEVAFMPAENLGYVLLINQSASPLRAASLGMVFDALLDEWPDESEKSRVETEDPNFEDYTGIYIADFATFRDAPFEVLIHDDRLALDVPGQRTYDLTHPDAEGLWGFALTDQVHVSFQRDVEAAVVGLTMHQGGFHFEVPRAGLELVPEVPASELEKYVGTFVRAEGDKRVELSIEKGLLTMDDKGKWLAFETPDAEGHAALRARADFGATFATDAEGLVPSFVFHGSSGDKLFTRLAVAPDTELPTLAEILALRDTDARIAAVQADSGTRFSGEVWIAQAGVRGTVTIFTQGKERYANHLDFGQFGRADMVARGTEAWSYNSMRGFDALKGAELTQAILDHPGAVEGDWADYFDSIEVVRNDTLDGRPVHVVRLEREGLPSRTYWVDAEHGDVLRLKQIAIEGPVRVPVTITYSDFQEFDGLRVPMGIELENPMSGRMVLTFESVTSGLELGDDVFTLVDPDASEAR